MLICLKSELLYDLFISTFRSVEYQSGDVTFSTNETGDIIQDISIPLDFESPGYRAVHEIFKVKL